VGCSDQDPPGGSAHGVDVDEEFRSAPSRRFVFGSGRTVEADNGM
jgi:hypothetical protein